MIFICSVKQKTRSIILTDFKTKMKYPEADKIDKMHFECVKNAGNGFSRVKNSAGESGDGLLLTKPSRTPNTPALSIYMDGGWGRKPSPLEPPIPQGSIHIFANL